MPTTIDALLPRTRQRVLAAVLMHPERWWYVRDLARHLGSAPSNVLRELERLLDAGILERRAEGQHVYFRANERCPIYPELRSLLRKTVGLADVVQEALAPLVSRIRVAFVYGSLARGEEQSASDVDLFVVGDVSLVELSAALRGVQRTLQRDVNPTVFGAEELAAKVKGKNHFVTSVLGGEKLFVLGGEDDLEAASRRRQRRKASNQPRRGR